MPSVESTHDVVFISAVVSANQKERMNEKMKIYKKEESKNVRNK
jgi:hypothetical protein